MSTLSAPLRLRPEAEREAARLPELRAAARHLADAVQLGLHGRRRAGPGEDFWQFRRAVAGDPVRAIDWRRSGRDDFAYIREREWQAAQSVYLWVDPGRSMAFSGAADRPAKRDRAQVLALALALLLLRSGERVGLLGGSAAPQAGHVHADRLALDLLSGAAEADNPPPPPGDLPRGCHLILLSDFLGPTGPVDGLIAAAAERRAHGALIQVLDPIEEEFPFDGRTRFESVSGATRFETLRARGLRNAYLERLAARRADLGAAAGRAGWRMTTHHTGGAAGPALIWLFHALEGAERR